MSEPERCRGCDKIMFLNGSHDYCDRCSEEIYGLGLGALGANQYGAKSLKYKVDPSSGETYIYQTLSTEEPKPMTQPEYLAHAKEVCDEIQRVIKAKSSDYANEQDALANFRGASDFGVSDLTGLLLRMNDKFQRAKAYSKRGDLKVADEGIEDVFMDLIGYSIAALALLKTEK